MTFSCPCKTISEPPEILSRSLTTGTDAVPINIGISVLSEHDHVVGKRGRVGDLPNPEETVSISTVMLPSVDMTLDDMENVKMIRHSMMVMLSLPASTVASESAFSTSGRVISDYRSRLTSKTVSALLEMQSWMIVHDRAKGRSWQQNR